MRNVVIYLVFTAAIIFSHSIYAQELDSFLLTNSRCMPGDTTTIELLLNNQSFCVGGFRAVIVMPDSFQAQFISADRGTDVYYFNYINFVPFSAGKVGIIGIASIPPRHASPLPIGTHELASFKIAISEEIAIGTTLPIMFYAEESYDNAITDSTGNIVLEPTTIDGQIIIGEPVDIDSDITIPQSFELKNNFPNPFNASTTISFTISTEGYVNLEIYDIQGRKVCQLLDEYLGAGNHSIIWNGLSDNGNQVSSGIYLYRLTLNNDAVTKKMNLIK